MLASFVAICSKLPSSHIVHYEYVNYKNTILFQDMPGGSCVDVCQQIHYHSIVDYGC